MKKCQRCGRRIPSRELYYCTGKKTYLCKDCYNDYFWEKVLSEKDRLNSDGTCYVLDPTFTGFAKRHFTVIFNDGRVIEDTGLWFIGKIPEEHKQEDDCKIIERNQKHVVVMGFRRRHTPLHYFIYVCRFIYQ